MAGYIQNCLEVSVNQQKLVGVAVMTGYGWKLLDLKKNLPNQFIFVLKHDSKVHIAGNCRNG